MINLYLADLQHMDMEDVVAEVMTEYVQLSQEVKTLRETIQKVRWHYMRKYVQRGYLNILCSGSKIQCMII